MIYYFSGTGNSQWVAKQLGEKLGEEVLNLAQVEEPEVSERIILVCPIYAWSIPGIVMRFARKLTLSSSTKLYLVVTCGDNVGQAIKGFSKEFALSGAYSVTMPNNYVIGFNVDSYELTLEKLMKAKIEVEQIAQEIAAGKSIERYEKGKWAWYFGGTAGSLFQKFGRSTKSFYSQDHCTSCGRCARECPVHMIKLQEGRPVWQEGSCEMCLLCLHSCPVGAIQYGKTTVGKGRYTLEGFQKKIKE